MTADTTPDVEQTEDTAAETAATETPDTEPAAPTETFAEMAERLFHAPFPAFDDPIIITAEMRHDSDAALAEYAEASDQTALIRFHTRQAQEWGAVVAREQAARLAS